MSNAAGSNQAGQGSDGSTAGLSPQRLGAYMGRMRLPVTMSCMRSRKTPWYSKRDSRIHTLIFAKPAFSSRSAVDLTAWYAVQNVKNMLHSNCETSISNIRVGEASTNDRKSSALCEDTFDDMVLRADKKTLDTRARLQGCTGLRCCKKAAAVTGVLRMGRGYGGLLSGRVG